MNSKRPDKHTLDAVGRRLVRAGCGDTLDIETLVSDPTLFARVQERIDRQEERWAGRPELTAVLDVLIAHRAAFAGVAAVVLVAAAFVAGRLGTDTETGVVQTVVEVQVPAAEPEVARPVIPPPPQGIQRKLSTGRAFSEDFTVEKAVMTLRPPAPRVNKPVPAERSEQDGKFYGLSYGGDPRESGSRIIRVDMSRSSLLALGVNIPLENDNGDGTVKADLLVSRDGVTRAIRFVE